MPEWVHSLVTHLTARNVPTPLLLKTMDTLPSSIKDIIPILINASSDDKITLMELLKNSLAEDKVKPPTPVKLVTSGHVSNLVSNIPDLQVDSKLLEDLSEELHSLKLGSNSKKVKTQWLSPSTEPYIYGDAFHHSKSITNYTSICKLMSIVNQNSDTTGNMDCCLVSCFSTANASLSLHADDEDTIDTKSSICTFSIGAPRTLEFCPKFWKPKKPCPPPILGSFPVTHGGLTVMKPGCQSVLKHRIIKGTHQRGKSNLRVSLSFRKLATNLTTQHSPDKVSIVIPGTSEMSTHCSLSHSNSSQSVHTQAFKQRKPKVTLLAGDSFLDRLDPARLGKNKKRVISIAKGGNKISQVQNSIENFASEHEDLVVEKLFLNFGTNDIRHCRSGVNHLKSHVISVIKKAKELFPTSKIFVQSLIPLPPNGNPAACRNVTQMNSIIYDVCSRYHVLYLDVFWDFLTYSGFRSTELFPTKKNIITGLYDIHPNSRGMGVLAKNYIFLIHSRRFNPLGY